VLPVFSAGSHIDVHLPGGLVRQYSLCNDPRENHRYLIGVLKTPDSCGGSRAMHELMQGAKLAISEPRNHFALAPQATHSILVAGGIGITPLLSMAEQLAIDGASFELHYCARSLEKIAFKERLALDPLVARAFLHLDNQHDGQRFDARALLERCKHGRTHLYICGPGPFIDMVLQAARACGYGEDQLHREYFSATQVAPSADGADQPFQVRIASSGKVFDIGVDDTVVSVLAEHGLDLPTSCEQGICGTCVTRILAGTPWHRDVFLTDAEHAANDQFTPCCSRSHTSVLVLDL
jgi:vanillate O-demethylase ferredoxin subunit